MKHIIIAGLMLFFFSANSQTLYKSVNGVKVEFTKADYALREKDSLDNITKVNAEFLIQIKRDATIRTLKSKGYSVLQGVPVGSTLTAAQRDVAIWISLWNTGAINPATNKIDSILSYIK